MPTSSSLSTNVVGSAAFFICAFWACTSPARAQGRRLGLSVCLPALSAACAGVRGAPVLGTEQISVAPRRTLHCAVLYRAHRLTSSPAHLAHPRAVMRWLRLVNSFAAYATPRNELQGGGSRRLVWFVFQLRVHSAHVCTLHGGIDEGRSIVRESRWAQARIRTA